MGGSPLPRDPGVHDLNPLLDEIPPRYVGFTLTKVKKSETGERERWSLCDRTEMRLSEQELLRKIENEKAKGVSVQKKYLHTEFQGIKRTVLDREIESQNQRDPRFKYTLASLNTREGRTARQQRTTIAIHVILERQPIPTRVPSPGLDLTGIPTHPPVKRLPTRSGFEPMAPPMPHESHEPRSVRHRPEEHWGPMERSEPLLPPSPPSPLLPPPPPPPLQSNQPHSQPHPQLHPQSHPQTYPPSHPQTHPQSHPQFPPVAQYPIRPVPQSHPSYPSFHNSPPQFMDVHENRPMPGDFFGPFPEEHVRNLPQDHLGPEAFKASNEHERRAKATPLASDYDSLESASDDSGFSGAKTHGTGDTEYSDHGGHDSPKQSKHQHHRKEASRDIDPRADRSHDRRRDNNYTHDHGPERKDSLHQPRHRRDAEPKNKLPYRVHRRRSPQRSPNSSLGSSSTRYLVEEVEYLPARTQERPSSSRRNSQEQRAKAVHSRRYSGFAQPVAIHDDRQELREDIREEVKEDLKQFFADQLERGQLRLENDALLRENERMQREQEKKRLIEQENDRAMKGGRDRWGYAEARSVFPEPRYNPARPQRFSRDLESNRYPF